MSNIETCITWNVDNDTKDIVMKNELDNDTKDIVMKNELDNISEKIYFENNGAKDETMSCQDILSSVGSCSIVSSTYDGKKYMKEKYMGKQYKNIVLSGGAIKGLSMLGSMQYMYDNDFIDPSSDLNFYTISVGSIIAYLLIIGYTPIEILVQICTKQFLQLFAYPDMVLLANGHGAYNWDVIGKFLEELSLQKIGCFLTMKGLYDKFGKQFNITTYNMTTHSTEIINHTTHPDVPCIIALRMSSNVPILFSKFKYTDNYYVDGGLEMKVPIQYIDDKTLDTIVIILQSSKKDDDDLSVIPYLFRILSERNSKHLESCMNKYNSDKTDILNITSISTTSFSVENNKALDLFSKGYKDTENYYCEKIE